MDASWFPLPGSCTRGHEPEMGPAPCIIISLRDAVFFNRPGRVHGERECDARTPLCAPPSSSSPTRCCGRAATLDQGGEPRPQGMDDVRGCCWRRSVRARQNCYYNTVGVVVCLFVWRNSPRRSLPSTRAKGGSVVVSRRRRRLGAHRHGIGVVCRFDEWCLPPAARGAIGVSRRGVGLAGPPPTSPPTVIVAVIGINQGAQLATTTATTEAPNAGDEWCLPPAARGGDRGGSASHYCSDDGGTKRRGRVVPPSRSTGGDRATARQEPQQPCADDSPDLEACTVWAVWKQPTVPIVGAAPRGGDYYSEEEEPLLATDQAKQNDDDQTGNNGGGGGCARPNGRRRHKEPQQPCADDSPTSGHARSRQYGHTNTTHGRRPSPRRGQQCARPNGRRRRMASLKPRPVKSRSSPALTTTRPRGTHGRGSMDTPTLPTVGEAPRGGGQPVHTKRRAPPPPCNNRHKRR
ncbi:hypothetical protein O3P69_017108 [Scylla paramamosain]|uniref:Uncharacterized protein n=1 Tax=Scylla paramamosain TaxID=85552 RepID=A0AAW0TTT8_SCYPA